MIPDSSIPGNYPEHIETYHLPHVIIKGDLFWGQTQTGHLFYSQTEKRYETVSFCYTNSGNLFCSFNPTKGLVMLMSRQRYLKNEWNLKETWRLVWDSQESLSTHLIRMEIENCSRFKIAMLDSEHIWNIHPVDLPMYYSDEESFELKTVMGEYPVFFRSDQEIRNRLIERFPDYFNHFFGLEGSNPETVELGFRIQRYNLGFEAPKFPCFYSVRSDGTYRNLFDIPRNTTQNYLRLKVFASES